MAAAAAAAAVDAGVRAAPLCGPQLMVLLLLLRQRGVCLALTARIARMLLPACLWGQSAASTAASWRTQLARLRGVLCM
jgi:hypothetical protein